MTETSNAKSLRVVPDSVNEIMQFQSPSYEIGREKIAEAPGKPALGHMSLFIIEEV